MGPTFGEVKDNTSRTPPPPPKNNSNKKRKDVASKLRAENSGRDERYKEVGEDRSAAAAAAVFQVQQRNDTPHQRSKIPDVCRWVDSYSIEQPVTCET